MQTDLPIDPPAEAGKQIIARALPPGQRGIVLGLWMGLLLFGTVALYPGSVPGEGYWHLVWLGTWLAQACLPALWTTLAEQPPSVRLPRALGLTAVLTLAAAWGSSRNMDDQILTLVFAIPVIGLVAFTPLALIRWLLGWRIAIPTACRPSDQRSMQFTLRQLLVWMGSTAVLLAWAKCVLPDGKTLQQQWQGLDVENALYFAAVFGALCLPTLIPSIGLALARTNRIWFALGTLAGVGLFMSVFLFFMGGPGPIDWQEDIPQLAILESTILGVHLGTLLILRFCGYRLLRRKEQRLATEPPASGHSESAVRCPGCWQTPFPYLVAAIVLVGLLLCWPAWKLETLRREIAAETEILRPWQQVGIGAQISEGRVIGISFDTTCPLSEAGLKKLQELRTTPTFERLSLYGTRLTDGQVHYLCGQTTLRSLGLENTAITDAGLAQLNGLDNLQCLRLDNTRVTDAGLKYLHKFPSLEVLSLNGTRITAAGLAQLKSLPKLTSLWLASLGITDADLKQLQTFENLEELGLGGNRITGEGFAQLGGLTKLHILHLNSTQVTDASLKHLAKFANLQLLSLEGTPITGDGLIHLADLKWLGTLNLNGTPITDASLKHLAQFENLMALSLQGTTITDAGLVHLRAVKKLRRLEVTGTAVTDAGLEEFRRAKPECGIEK